jgi:pimeloyl-ACP methyl ester carboxylesterase
MPYVTNKGVRIHYEVKGKGSPLVLVHGQCANLQAWYDYGYVEPLMKKSRLVLVDVRGHGLSDKPHNSKIYTMKLIVSDIVAVLDDLKIRKAHFLGYSLGGWIVFGIAKYAPERIHSLIIGSAHPYAPSATERAEFDSEIQLWKKGTEAVIAAIEKRRRSKMTPKTKAMLMSNDPKAIAALMSGEDYTINLEDFLPTMKMPCLVYCGEGDGNYSGAKKCVNSIPNATFVSLPGLSHLETFFQSDVVLPHITKFLEGVKHTRSN